MSIIHIYETQKPSNSTQVDLMIEEPVIDTAYFAEKEVRKVFDIQYEIHEVTRNNETLKSIAAQYKSDNSIEEIIQEIIEINNLKKNIEGEFNLLVDSRLGVPIKLLKGEEVYFNPISQVNINKPFYLIVETEKLKGKTMRIYIKQGGQNSICASHQTFPIMDGNGNVQSFIDVKVGAWIKSNNLNPQNVLNSEDYKNWAISEVKLSPTTESELATWNAAIEASADKVEPLYIMVDPYSQNDYFMKGDNRVEKLYYGGETNRQLKIPVDNLWFDYYNKAFELAKSLTL